MQKAAAAKRNKYAGACYEKGNGSGLHKFLEVSLKPRRKHKENNTYLGHFVKELGGFHKTEDAGSYDQTGYDLANYLGSLELTRKDTETLGKDYYYREVSEKNK